MENLIEIASQFEITDKIVDVKPIGEGLINDTYKVFVNGSDKPKYVLQRINNAVFQDVDMLMDNINKVTDHLRKKGKKTLRFYPTKSNKYYYLDEISPLPAVGRNDGKRDDFSYWRLMDFVPDSITYQTINPHYSYLAGKSFGEF
jgi:hypothetical protein